MQKMALNKQTFKKTIYMNVLDLPIQEVAIKIDNEDLGVLLSALNLWGQSCKADSVEDRMKVFSLRKLRQKLEIRQSQTKGSKKEFKLRIEPVQAYGMMNLLSLISTQLPKNSYEANVCLKFRDDFHKKLLTI